MANFERISDCGSCNFYTCYTDSYLYLILSQVSSAAQEIQNETDHDEENRKQGSKIRENRAVDLEVEVSKDGPSLQCKVSVFFL